ncbi:MAG: site-2 protease family protein [Candidatus Woesearchaeota archaeon]
MIFGLDFNLVLFIIFIIAIGIFLLIKRKNLEVQKIIFPVLYLLLYRTKLGLKWMDKSSKKYPDFWKWFGIIAIVIGFIGMIFISFILIDNILKIFFIPGAKSGAGLVLPIKAKGVFFVPFIFWIICIFILSIVHEFSHGVLARRYDMKLKSSGFGFMSILLPIIPLAFVEPDEKKLQKKPNKEQLSVLAAGPFSNIVLGLLCLLIFLGLSSIGSNLYNYTGVGVRVYKNESFAAYQAGMQDDDIISMIDNTKITTVADLSNVLETKKGGDKIVIITNASTYYNVTLGSIKRENQLCFICNKVLPSYFTKEKAQLGVDVYQVAELRKDIIQKYGQFSIDVFLWFMILLSYLYIFNIGVGTFNLLPLPIVDGGRMFYLGMNHWFGKEKAMHITKYVYIFFVLILLLLVFFAFFRGIGI